MSVTQWIIVGIVVVIAVDVAVTSRTSSDHS